METYHKIPTPFRRDMDGSVTGRVKRLIVGDWKSPELKYLANNEWEFTEKVDGMNIRIGLETDENLRTRVVIAGRSDNALIPKKLLEYLENTFTLELFRDNKLESVTLFGEGYGVRGFGDGRYSSEPSFVLFDVKVGDWWLKYEAVEDVADKLGIETVPLIGRGTLYQAINYVTYGTPYLPEEIDRIENYDPSALDRLKAPLRSRWGNFEAEGIVARPAVPMFDRQGNRIITKIKGRDFR